LPFFFRRSGRRVRPLSRSAYPSSAAAEKGPGRAGGRRRQLLLPPQRKKGQAPAGHGQQQLLLPPPLLLPGARGGEPPHPRQADRRRLRPLLLPMESTSKFPVPAPSEAAVTP